MDDKYQDLWAKDASISSNYYKHIRDAMLGQMAVKAKPLAPRNPIETAADHELVMELLSRGYAVSKMRVDELAEEMAK